jgi:hypothetical protein
MAQDSEKRDLFAQIGAEHQQLRDNLLVEPQPPVLPEIIISSSKHDPQAVFTPVVEIRSEAAIKREVARLRRKFEPFLKDYAPAAVETRKRLDVTEFDWRIAKPEDLADLGGVIAGNGSWEKVTVPHFGPPLGRAVTFYRTIVNLDAEMIASGSVFLCFDGVDYKAHAFLNGCYAGSHEGFFAKFEFDVTASAKVGENTLLVKVENDAISMGNDSWGEDGPLYDGDKIYAATGPGFDDPEIGWHHCPPGMGIYQDVYIEARKRAFINDIFVRPVNEENRAEAWIEIFNVDITRKDLAIELSVFGQNFRKTVFKDRPFDIPNPAGPTVNYYRLPFDIKDMRVWDVDTPWLYQIQVTLKDSEGTVLDVQTKQFGMRSFTMDEVNEPKGRMYLNGRQIRLRGSNTMGFEQQDVMHKDWSRLIDDVLLAKVCNMNYWRLTQRPVQDKVYEFCDQLGFLLQTDLPQFGVVRRNQFCETVREAEEMERLVRNHPCNIMVTYINEPFPAAWGKSHRYITRMEMEGLFRNASEIIKITNPDRVIKAVDGDYDPPGPGMPDNHCYNCWYNGHGLDIGRLHKGYWQAVKPGWMYGCGEFGTEGLEAVETMRAHYPKSWLPQTPEEEKTWMPDPIVQSQTGRFHYMWFETKHALADWVKAGQAHQAWATRLMTQAFRRDSNLTSIAIHLFIDAFPSGWMKTIVDVDRRIKPAFYEYRDALTPLMVNLRTDRFKFFSAEKARFEAWICNDTNDITEGSSIQWQLEKGNMILLAGKSTANVPLCSSEFQGFLDINLPEVNLRTNLVLRLALFDKQGKQLHQTATEVTVFPKPYAAQSRVTVFGEVDGLAAKLANELGIATVSIDEIDADGCILIDDAKILKQNEKLILKAVKQGATAVVLGLPEGTHKVAGSEIVVQTAGMGARHFVSRDTGHKLVAGFVAEDFKFWFDEDLGYVSPFIDTTFSAEGWTPILLAGNGDWRGNWSPSVAVAEKKIGKGAVRICQVQLANRCKTNPIAAIFAGRLLEK